MEKKERKMSNTNETPQRCFLTRHRLTFVNVAMTIPKKTLKTRNNDTTAVETQGNRRREWADNEYAVILDSRQRLVTSNQPFRGKDNVWTRIIYNYTIMYMTLTQGLLGCRRDKILVFLLVDEKKNHSTVWG